MAESWGRCNRHHDVFETVPTTPTVAEHPAWQLNSELQWSNCEHCASEAALLLHTLLCFAPGLTVVVGRESGSGTWHRDGIIRSLILGGNDACHGTVWVPEALEGTSQCMSVFLFHFVAPFRPQSVGFSCEG